MDVRLEDGTIVKNVPDGITRSELMRRLGKAEAPFAQEPRQPGMIEDAARSIPGGLLKGATGAFELPRVLSEMGREPEAPATTTLGKFRQAVDRPGETIASMFGGYYEPKTTAGKYAETIASFAPAALGPGGVAGRIARVAVPGATSEAAGQATEGTGAEPYARVIGAMAGGGAIAVAPAIGRSAARAANRAASNVTGGNGFLNPETEAIRRLREAAVRDNPGTIANEARNWDASGASDPSLLDVSGNNVMRLIRSAASGGQGEAQNAAVSYADRIAGNLQDRAVTQARRLTPNEQRPAGAVADELELQQRQDARENYREPYSQPAAVTREMVSALQGPEGRGAIANAYADARANRDLEQMGQLQDLLRVADEQSGGTNVVTGRRQSLEQALAELSAGSLDRVRIAMRETGRRYAARNMNSRARGYGNRVRDIDTALDQTEGLRDARASYRDFQGRRDAVDVGRTGMNAAPDDYAAQVAELAGHSQGARASAGVGYRQAITDAIQRPAEGSTGALNRLATSNAQTQNLASTFGPEAAQRFQGAIEREARRLQKARQISPNTNSQTEGRLQDRALVNVVTGDTGGIFRSFVDWLRGSATLTDAERTAIVRLGTSEVDLRRLMQNLPESRRAELARQFAVTAQLSQPRNPQQ